MVANLLKFAAAAALCASSALTTAQAGGFARGSADTDVLFEEGNFNLRAGATIISPSRKYTVNLNPALLGTDYVDTYVLASAAVKLNVTEDLRCAGTYSQPFGGGTTYAAPTFGLGKLTEKFAVNELGLTCGYKFDLSKGRAWILGGVGLNLMEYDLVAAGGAVTIALNDVATTYRIGAAYEIPEYALRAQLMYTTGFDASAEGLANGFFPATGAANFPGNAELKIQSGVAPGWLVFGSVRWTDWSVTETLSLNSVAIGGSADNKYFWRDGWTVTGGVGHAFTDNLSGALSLTWDRGVATGYDLSSSTWTLGAGGSYKDSMGGELRFGGGITYIAGAATTFGAPEAVDAGWAYALSASYKTKW